MKKFLLATAVAAATFGAANAADQNLPAYKSVAAPARPACAQFGGGYVGVQAGWANLDSQWTDRNAWVDNFGTDWAIGTANNNKSSGTAGGQIGYDWQSGCTLWGVALDANWAGISWDKLYSPSGVAGTTTLQLSSKLNWYGSAQLRTGLVVDNLLLYVTGGLAYANLRHNFTVTDAGGTPTVESFSAKQARWGGVIGVGTEWQFSRKWSLKSEFLYFRFQEATTGGFSPNGPDPVQFDNNDALWVSRIGLNYRW